MTADKQVAVSYAGQGNCSPAADGSIGPKLPLTAHEVNKWHVSVSVCVHCKAHMAMPCNNISIVNGCCIIARLVCHATT